MVAINICNYLNLNKLKLNKIPSSVALAALQVFNSCMRPLFWPAYRENIYIFAETPIGRK